MEVQSSTSCHAPPILTSACTFTAGSRAASCNSATRRRCAAVSSAFFTAGARALMVSHWPVMSGAAVQLSVGTMERAVQRGEPLAKSLQQAMQAARKDGAGNPMEAHPSYWGPFVIVGDGR